MKVLLTSPLSPVDQAQVSPRCPSPWLSRAIAGTQHPVAAPQGSASHQVDALPPSSAMDERGPLTLLAAEAIVCLVLRGASSEAEAEAESVEKVETATMKDAIRRAERSLAAARGGCSADSRPAVNTMQGLPRTTHSFAALRLGVSLARHVLPALSMVVAGPNTVAHGDARAHALQLLVDAVIQLGHLTTVPASDSAIPQRSHRGRLSSAVCSVLDDGLLLRCTSTLSDFAPLPQVRLYVLLVH